MTDVPIRMKEHAGIGAVREAGDAAVIGDVTFPFTHAGPDAQRPPRLPRHSSGRCAGTGGPPISTFPNK